MSLEAKVKERFGEDLNPVEDVEDLDLAGLLELKSFSPADKAYLERFTHVACLMLKDITLENLANMPALPNLRLVWADSSA